MLRMPASSSTRRINSPWPSGMSKGEVLLVWGNSLSTAGRNTRKVVPRPTSVCNSTKPWWLATACVTAGEAADAPRLEPSREVFPPRRRVVNLAQADPAPHPGAAFLQERGPQIAVDQVPDRQPHLVLERGGPVLPADRLLTGAGVLGQRAQGPHGAGVAAVEMGMQIG